jgi:hypothetical protein
VYVQTVKENVEALVVAAKETGLEVNADKTKYMVRSRDRNAGRGHSVTIDNSSIKRVEEFKYLGTTLTDQNYSLLSFGAKSFVFQVAIQKLKDQDI